MKRFYVSCIMLLLGVFCYSLNADTLYKKGYRANVEINAGTTFGGKNSIGREFSGSVLTSHGYSTGKGLYIGLGTGLTVTPNNYALFSIPIFADVKYSFSDKMFSPFISAKAGTEINLDNGSAGLCLAPSVGFDMNRFSVFLRYDFGTGKASWMSSNKFVEKNYSKHVLSVGGSYWF